MKVRKWKAVWTDHENEQKEFVFYSSEHRTIADMDFQWSIVDRGYSIPEHYTLEGVGPVLDVHEGVKR